jgi:hypothetical protein
MGSINIGPRHPLRSLLTGELIVLVFPVAVWARLLDLDPRARFWLACAVLAGTHAVCWDRIDRVRRHREVRDRCNASSSRRRPVGGIHIVITLFFDIAVGLPLNKKRENP